MALAVKVVVVDTPFAWVLAESAMVLLANVPLAPLAWAVKVTVLLATNTGLPNVSSTVALKGLTKSEPRAAFCPPPPVATTWEAAAATIVNAGLLATGVESTEVFTLTDAVPAAVVFTAVAPTPATSVTADDELTVIGIMTVTLFAAVSVGPASSG